MLFGVISRLQNWHTNYIVAQRLLISDSDKSFLDENTSFNLTFNKIALIMYWKLKKMAGKKEKHFLFVL